MNKKIHIIGGGTIAHVSNHMALSAPAYGSTAKHIRELFMFHPDNKLDIEMHLTKMCGKKNAGQSDRVLETNEDIEKLIDELIERDDTKIIVFNPALCDFEPMSLEKAQLGRGRETSSFSYNFGKYETRLNSRDYGQGTDLGLWLKAAVKIVNKIRAKRKDIFLVAFKTTCGVTEDEQYIAALNLLKGAGCNLVLANDTKTRVNMIVTPEEARYHVTTHRGMALTNLVDMALLRSHLSFTRSTVVSGEAIPWSSPLVPQSLRDVVDACIAAGAYKPFRGATVGHFAVKIGPREFLTSKRKTNFNDLATVGLVRVTTDGDDTVTAYGAKPSVGGQSQRIVFDEHPETDCIVHFHCPLLDEPAVDIPIRSQREFECGSHQCGQNTSSGLAEFVLDSGTVVKAVHLDQHGPNLVFNQGADSNEIVKFIISNWNLAGKTGGYVTLP